MRHKKNTLKLNRTVAHRKALLSNLVTSLVQHEKIYTTVAKAKAVKSLVDKLISMAKRGDLHSRRRVARTIKDKSILQKLFSDIAPRYQDHQGGYCRMIFAGRRIGDNAPLAVIELIIPGAEVPEEEKGQPTTNKKTKKKAEPEKAVSSDKDKETPPKKDEQVTEEKEETAEEAAKEEGKEVQLKEEASEKKSPEEEKKEPVIQEPETAPGKSEEPQEEKQEEEKTEEPPKKE